MSLDLTIVTPEGRAYRDAVEAVVLPGSEGAFGVLAGHERFISPLCSGELEIRAPAGSVFAAVSEGFAEVNGDAVTVLVETCELADSIDLARAERARDRAEVEIQRLRDSGEPDEAFGPMEAALARALARVVAARRASRFSGPGTP